MEVVEELILITPARINNKTINSSSNDPNCEAQGVLSYISRSNRCR